MKLGRVEVSGIQRIVENRKVVWERYRNRWVKFINGEDFPRGGMSVEEMHHYLQRRVYDERCRVWLHNESINIERYKK